MQNDCKLTLLNIFKVYSTLGFINLIELYLTLSDLAIVYCEFDTLDASLQKIRKKIQCIWYLAFFTTSNVNAFKIMIKVTNCYIPFLGVFFGKNCENKF